MIVFEKIAELLGQTGLIFLLVCFFVYLIVKEIIWFFKEFELIDRAIPRNEKEMKLLDLKRALNKMGVQFKRNKKNKKSKKKEEGEEPSDGDAGEEGW